MYILIKTHTVESGINEIFVFSKISFLLQIILQIVNNLVFGNFFCLFDILYAEGREMTLKGGQFAKILEMCRVLVITNATGAAAPINVGQRVHAPFNF